MATTLQVGVHVSVCGTYRVTGRLAEIFQRVQLVYGTTYADGESTEQAEVIHAISATNTGSTQTYDLAPLVDEFGTSNTWTKLRAIIISNNDALTSTKRLFLAGTLWVNTFNISPGSANQIIRAGGLYLMESPGTFGLTTSITPGSTDTVTLFGNGASVGDPIPYDLVFLGTK